MSTWARIANGVVMELTPIDPTNRFHPSLTWADCTATPGVAQGWLASETTGVWTFTAPPAVPPS